MGDNERSTITAIVVAGVCVLLALATEIPAALLHTRAVCDAAARCRTVALAGVVVGVVGLVLLFDAVATPTRR
jgi:hypothetical protein